MSEMVCLTVLVPMSAEDRVIDFLLAHGSGNIEFSMHVVAARGPLVRMQRHDERVRGFAQRMEIKLIVDPAVRAVLVDGLRNLLAGVDGGFWVTPVLQFEPFALFEATALPQPEVIEVRP